jgi:nitrilase
MHCTRTAKTFTSPCFPAQPFRRISTFIALEGRVFVLCASGLLSAHDVPQDHPYYDLIANKPPGFFNGGSCIVAPDGTFAVAPLRMTR